LGSKLPRIKTFPNFFWLATFFDPFGAGSRNKEFRERFLKYLLGPFQEFENRNLKLKLNSEKKFEK